MRLVLALALLLSCALPAGAHAFPEVGFGEQRPGIFTDSHWTPLGLKNVRIVVGWDATSTAWQRNELDGYFAAARAAGARVLVAFGRSRVASRNRYMPKVSEYRAAFKAFRRRYPDVSEFIVWNEANHCSQPICHKPWVAARYYNAMRSVCAGSCTIVAADVLDTPDMEWYLRKFRRHARPGLKIWGLHNYLDANRFRRSGTRRMLRTVAGPIWFTETGGLVRRRGSSIRFPDSPSHAARATRWVFQRLAPLSPRIQRIYLYHWSYPPKGEHWDSALMTPRGRPRPAYRVLVEELQRGRRAQLQAQQFRHQLAAQQQ